MGKRRFVVALALVASGGPFACNAILGNDTGGYAAIADASLASDARMVEAGSDAGGDPLDCTGKNLSSDGNHCGSCNHSCLGGACALARCQPVVLFDGPVSYFAVAGERVYFTSPNHPSLRSVEIVPVAGSAPQIHGGDAGQQPSRVAASAKWISWREGTDVYRLTVNGTKLGTSFATDDLAADRGFAAEGTDLFVVDAIASRIYRYEDVNTSQTLFRQIQENGSLRNTAALAVTKERVYWSEHSGLAGQPDHISVCPRTSPTPCTTASVKTHIGHDSLERIDTLAVSDGLIVAAGKKNGGLSNSSIAVAPDDDASPLLPLVEVNKVRSVQADALHIYFPSDVSVAGGAKDAIYRMQRDGGAVTTIAESQVGSVQVYVDDRAIYWSKEEGGRGGGTGGLIKLAK